MRKEKLENEKLEAVTLIEKITGKRFINPQEASQLKTLEEEKTRMLETEEKLFHDRSRAITGIIQKN